EVKRAQQLGMADYPVFSRKAATDLSYIACATRLLAAPEPIYPAFATHNCRTAATILEIAGGREFEFQKLVGMGDALYEALLAERNVTVRMYAPVGSFTDLLPYLVRRMLENGANTSFVHQIADPEVPLAALVADPLAALPEPYRPNERIPLPHNVYPDRLNALGLDLARRDVLAALHRKIASGRPLMAVAETGAAELQAAIGRASQAFERWSRVPAGVRAAYLETAAELLEGRIAEFVSLIVREGGRTYADAVAEVREAADFCRYYALQARRHFAEATVLPGPAGEHNELQLHGRGVFACISPWNFPLAIFSGQIAAALVTGNTVIAKPAEQTNLVAQRMVGLLHEAGVPREALQLALGEGDVGAALTKDERIGGVAFTGSVEVARLI